MNGSRWLLHDENMVVLIALAKKFQTRIIFRSSFLKKRHAGISVRTLWLLNKWFRKRINGFGSDVRTAIHLIQNFTTLLTENGVLFAQIKKLVTVIPLRTPTQLSPQNGTQQKIRIPRIKLQLVQIKKRGGFVKTDMNGRLTLRREKVATAVPIAPTVWQVMEIHLPITVLISSKKSILKNQILIPEIYLQVLRKSCGGHVTAATLMRHLLGEEQ